ncbi:MAG: ACT domain-containing protein [Egibacteraceae bacterium]
MEILLRCAVPDRPGALAALAGAIGSAGGDIEAVDVVESEDGTALDDLFVRVSGPEGLRAVVENVRAVEGVKLIHAGPSRGHPGDAVTRAAIGLEAILSGAMTIEHGVEALVGGLLRATRVTFEAPDDAPACNDRVLVLPFAGHALVLRRDYRFTETEIDRARSLLRVCREAVRTAEQGNHNPPR